MTIQNTPEWFARWRRSSLPPVWDSWQVVLGLGRTPYNQAACVAAPAVSTRAAGQSKPRSRGGRWARPETADERSYSLVSAWLAATPSFWRRAKTQSNFSNPKHRCSLAGLLFLSRWLKSVQGKKGGCIPQVSLLTLRTELNCVYILTRVIILSNSVLWCQKSRCELC